MYNNSYISVLIAAAGQGKRMKSDINKQYLKLLDKPIIIHTIESFIKTQCIDDIILIVHGDEVDLCKDVIHNYFPSNRIRIIKGGTERQFSIYNGLKSLSRKDNHIVLIHDGARPFITKDIIIKSIDEAIVNKAVGVGVPVKDTIKVVDEELNIIDTPKRSDLWSIQTPQVFQKDLIVKAYEKADEDGYLGTDDSMLVERIGYTVKMIMGSYDNIKITTPEDLVIGEAILKKRAT